MNRFWLAACFCAGAILSCKQKTNDVDTPYLSNLRAGRDAPVYTTYAAAIERSEFILDEGYEFSFYTPDKGLDFITDNGGDLCLGFLIDGEWIYRESAMYKAPLITTSYPDLVRYHYYPKERLRVEASFLVQSSHVAVWDLQIFNESAQSVEIEVVPFMRNDYRPFTRIRKNEDNAFVFSHEAYPDGWTVSHGLPYEDTVKNVFLLSEPADKRGAFNSLSGETPEIPFQVLLEKKSVYQLSGRAMKNKKERLVAQPPVARMQAYLNGDKSKLITENSPLFGMAQPSIDQQGYFRMELGNFGRIRKGDRYTFTFYNEKEHLFERYTQSVDKLPSGERKDVFLDRYSLPQIPHDVKITQEGNAARLRWQGDNQRLVYDVYRREYPEGTYQRVADNVSDTSFKDTPNEGALYGYIIVAEDPSTGETGMHSREVNTFEMSSFGEFLKNGASSEEINSQQRARVIAFRKAVVLDPDEKKAMRIIRVTGRSDNSDEKMIAEAKSMLREDITTYQEENEELFSQIPKLEFEDPDKEMLYWSAFNMMRQVFYPPEGKSSYNYYVFSREPTWGWGHGGQVFHESIAMLAYAYMDGESAMNSQRVYSERQYDNGYINYRTGSYLDEIIEHNGQLTSSAPWYAWQNWEVYKITKDKKFLEEMYASSKAFYNFYVSNRDSDGDGLCEWGGHAVLESVRDALVAVWDEVGWPANFEGVDLNSMLVKEAKALESMATELGLADEAIGWKSDYEHRSRLINETFWDEESGFYFNVDKKDNDFTFEEPNDLKREEIIGFLPLWAGVATEEQAEKLVAKLTDPGKFWRKYGVPSLAADDPYYNDKGYWNGPVWVEWDFLIMQGLLDYGYGKEAKQLVDKVADGMIIQLKKNHNLWEFYSPDDEWAGYHKTYIWAGIINRMMMDVRSVKEANREAGKEITNNR